MITDGSSPNINQDQGIATVYLTRCTRYIMCLSNNIYEPIVVSNVLTVYYEETGVILFSANSANKIIQCIFKTVLYF